MCFRGGGKKVNPQEYINLPLNRHHLMTLGTKKKSNLEMCFFVENFFALNVGYGRCVGGEDNVLMTPLF